jgi:hypothetical protein
MVISFLFGLGGIGLALGLKVLLSKVFQLFPVQQLLNSFCLIPDVFQNVLQNCVILNEGIYT